MLNEIFKAAASVTAHLFVTQVLLALWFYWVFGGVTDIPPFFQAVLNVIEFGVVLFGLIMLGLIGLIAGHFAGRVCRRLLGH